jgi:hypothetical protein
MVLADRDADRKTGTSGGPGPESPIAGAVAGGVAAVVALLVLVALAVRVIG